MRFGFMHMVAANICVWIATTVRETHQEFVLAEPDHSSTTAHNPPATASGHHEDHDSYDGKSSELLTNITDGELIAASVGVQTIYRHCPNRGIRHHNFYTSLFVRLSAEHTRVLYKNG